MKLSKKIIIGIRILIIIPFLIIQLYVIIFTLPLLISLGMLIGASLGILGQGALLYYLLFKCQFKLIKRIFKKPIDNSPQIG